MIPQYAVALVFGAVSAVMLSIFLGLILGAQARRYDQLADWLAKRRIPGTNCYWIA